MLELEIEQGGEVGVGFKDDVAAFAAVAAGGASVRDIFFLAERDGAASAGARRDIDRDFINKNHGVLPRINGCEQVSLPQ